MLTAIRRKALYLLFIVSTATLLLGAPSAPIYADCTPVGSSTCTG